jgi:hypothetical protein
MQASGRVEEHLCGFGAILCHEGHHLHARRSAARRESDKYVNILPLRTADLRLREGVISHTTQSKHQPHT